MDLKSYLTALQSLDYNRKPPASIYESDLAKAGELWGKEFKSLTDLFSTKTPFDDGTIITAPTHMLGQTEENIRLIAYRNANNLKEFKNEWYQKDIARFILPGEFAICIHHCCPRPYPKPWVQLQFQCRHAQVIMGIENRGKPGVISISNPQSYYRQNVRNGKFFGLFGPRDDSMILLKPKFPGKLTRPHKWAYVHNIRTWMLIANTLTHFPEGDNYDGQDPLATQTLEEVYFVGKKLLAALTGDETAKEWLAAAENRVYCAELLHVGLNLGIHFPLNETFSGKHLYKKVKREIRLKAFLKKNENPFAIRALPQMAPENLKPITDLIDSQTPDSQTVFDSRLAVQPFTFIDVIQKFIEKTVPREKRGEDAAPYQAELLRKVQTAYSKAMRIDRAAKSSPLQKKVDQLYDQIVEVVGRRYHNYKAFREALLPYLRAARKLPDELEDVVNAFVPPHCFLVRATDSITGKPGQGMLGWQYLGHGLHESLLTRKKLGD